MGSLSKTAAAAQKAVERGQAKGKEVRTTERIIQDIRRLLEAHLAVPPDDVRLLLSEYDAAKAEPGLDPAAQGKDSIGE